MSLMSPEITDALLPLLHPGEKVIDIGSGDASLLRKLSGKGFALFGIDPGYQGGRLPPSPADVTLCPGSGESIPFDSASFDTAILQCVFSLCCPEPAVQEILRILKPGGRLILSDLYSAEEELSLSDSPLLSRLYLYPHLENYFRPYFQRVSFLDLTDALQEMVLEAIWNSDEGICIPPKDLSLLRRAHARYGLWVWRKPL